MSRLKAYRRLPPPETSTTTTITTISAATKSFNSTINRLSSQGLHRDVLSTFSSMLSSHTPPDAHTYPSLFKACTYLNKYSLGISLHQRVTIDGYFSDSYIASSLINFYAKFGQVANAHKVFDLMPDRNVVPWTAIIGCYSRFGDSHKACYLYNLMLYEGIQPSSVTLLNVLSGVSELSRLEGLHACAIRYGLDSDLNLVNCMLDLYGKCGRVEAARNLFEAMVCRDIVSWNSMVSGYSQSGDLREIMRLMKRMRSEGVVPDQQTFGSLLSCYDSLQSNVELGRVIHGQIITSGLEVDAPMATSLVVLYAKHGKVANASKIFEWAAEKDVILWTSVISAFVQNDNAHKALVLFTRMLDSGMTPSTATIATVLSACAKVGSRLLGISVHGYLLRQGMPADIPVQNSLITMYAKCGLLMQSLAIFDSMNERDVVSWNAIVAAFAQRGDLHEALCLFNKMRLMLQRPDSITVVSLLQACASTGALEQGKWVHSFIIKSLSQPSIMLDTALVDMYSKCGDLKTAYKCFRQMPEHDVVSWSTIITGYGSHSMGEIALNLFTEFLSTRIQPNPVIFLSVLFSCSHNGLVSEGLNIFESMAEEFGIKPELEHRACIVDLLCRAGRLKEAYRFIKTKLSDPTVDILGILLDACRMKGDTKLGELVARDIIMLQPVCAENYVQLAHSYASMNMWQGVGDAWMQMKALGLRKVPGWSYIQQHGKMTTFFNGQSDHPLFEEMVLALEILGCQMSDLNNHSSDQHGMFYNMDSL